jgi:hypothetical protein
LNLSQYLASGITAIYYYDLSRFDDKTISEMISNGAIPDVSPANTGNQSRYNKQYFYRSIFLFN